MARMGETDEAQTRLSIFGRPPRREPHADTRTGGFSIISLLPHFVAG